MLDIRSGRAGVDGSMKTMTLNCFNSQCDKSISFEINRLPQFSFELVEIAQKVGWVGSFDFPHSRCLVFCSMECDDKAHLKNGSYKLRG